MTRVRVLTAEDRPRALEIAVRCFGANRFYQKVLGYCGGEYSAYWELMFDLAIGDASARVYGLDLDGQIHGVLVATFDRFPAKTRAARFLAGLLLRLGPRRTLHYFQLVRAYDRAHAARKHDVSREARCFGLMIASTAGARFGPTFIREIRAALHREGKTFGTGVIDAADTRLVQFYRRLGFSISPPFVFLGGSASTIEIATSPGPRTET